MSRPRPSARTALALLLALAPLALGCQLFTGAGTSAFEQAPVVLTADPATGAIVAGEDPVRIYYSAGPEPPRPNLPRRILFYVRFADPTRPADFGRVEIRVKPAEPPANRSVFPRPLVIPRGASSGLLPAPENPRFGPDHQVSIRYEIEMYGRRGDRIAYGDPVIIIRTDYP